jgi:hypothetical protein
MRKHVGLCCLLFLAGSVFNPGQTAAKKEAQPGPQNPVEDRPFLSAEDKVEISEILRLKTEVGDQIWPGFAGADIPIVLFNARYEFLAGLAEPSGAWEIAPGDEFQGRPYFRRETQKPKAFAVRIGARWAGSIGTLGYMNGKIPLKLGPDFHMAMTLHEMFHAFQAEQAPERFPKALAVYKVETRYPYKDKEFAAAWTQEGAALAQALKATDDAGAIRLAQSFLKIRDARRGAAGLASELLDYERELEWLEGLAKYAEIRAYELAASHPNPASSIKFTAGLPFILRWDFVRLEAQLGAQDGDLRFDLSGMAQARLLDRLNPGWRSKLELGKVDLEDLIRAAVRK